MKVDFLKVFREIKQKYPKWQDECIDYNELIEIIKKHGSVKVREAKKGDILRKFSDDNKRKATPAEKKFKEFLNICGICYEFQKPIYVGGKGYILDFSIHSKALNKNICVEIDGEYHYTTEQRKKDNKRDKILHEAGWSVIRLSNHQVLDGPEKPFYYALAGAKARDIMKEIKGKVKVS